jgi:histidine phosphotransferase ChpT
MVSADKLPKEAVKVLLNLALVAGDALVRGGRLDIGAERGANATEIVIRAEGPRLLLDPNLRAVLERGATGTVEPRAAGAWLAHALITEAGGKLQLSPSDSQVLMIGAAF